MNDPGRFAVSRPKVQPPPNACDCHVHVFGPAAAYPYARRRRYTPEDATPGDCLAVMDTLGLERLVLVQPSPYGSDHSRMLDALAYCGDRARGIMVWKNGLAPSTLERMHAAGVRGVRLNFDPRERPRSLEKRLAGIAAAVCRLGWHIQMSVAPAFLVALEPAVADLPVPLVLEHMGRLNAETFRSQPGFTALCRLLRSGRAWVKLSGAYRATSDDGRLADAGDLARSLVAANPHRVVWGSDWPHTPKHGLESIREERTRPFRNIDTALLLELACQWAGDKETWETILVRNPERLYGFG